MKRLLSSFGLAGVVLAFVWVVNAQAPAPARKSIESHSGPALKPKATMHSPQPTMAAATPKPCWRMRPIRPVRGVSATAPMEVAAIRKPRPCAPTCRMALA